MSPFAAGGITLMTRYTMFNSIVLVKVKAKWSSGEQCKNIMQIISKYRLLNVLTNRMFKGVVAYRPFMISIRRLKWKTLI